MAVTTEGGEDDSRLCSPSAKWTRRRRKCFVDSVADADAVGLCDGTEAEEDCSPCGVEVLSANRRLLRILFGFNDGGVIMVVESIWPSSQSLSSLSLEKMCAADGTIMSSFSHSSSSKSTGC